MCRLFVRFGLSLGRLQESSGSGMYSGPLPPNISSRALSPYVDIVCDGGCYAVISALHLLVARLSP
jgi:hypothetical protein